MQVLGAQTLSFQEILQLLEGQGDFMLLGEESRQNPDWEAILAEPLFFEDISRGYRLNVEHASVVREYLGKLASSSQQKLLEPLTIAWDVRSDIYR